MSCIKTYNRRAATVFALLRSPSHKPSANELQTDPVDCTRGEGYFEELSAQTFAFGLESCGYCDGRP